MSESILPFKCDRCQREVDPVKRKLCDGCGRWICPDCTRKVAPFRHRKPICKDCAKQGRMANVWPYVWLSFYGLAWFVAWWVFETELWNLWGSNLGASILDAAIWVSPLLGIYAFFRVSKSPQKTNLQQGLAAIGLMTSIVVPVLLQPI